MQQKSSMKMKAESVASAGVFCLLMAVVFMLTGIDPALAQAGPVVPPEYAGSCTYNPQFNIVLPQVGGGIISLLVNNVSTILLSVSSTLYNVILSNPSFQFSVRAALTIFVIIYGIIFTFGLAQITMMDFIIRITKFAVVAAVVSPGSWNFFATYVVQFFQGGTDWLIAVMANIALPSLAGVNPNTPFSVLDNAISVLTSSRMFVTLIAVFFTGPYGVVIGLLILMGLFSFASALFQAMWIYLMSLVVRAFLFALAPIFFSFLLFARTRHLFDGWLNALVSSLLQPVFLFAFFAFFAKLVEASLYNLLRVPVCWTPVGTSFSGTPFSMWGWRFMVPVEINGVYRWEMWAGDWSFMGAGCKDCPVFPLSIMDVLIFLLIVQLASKFNGVVVQIAKEIAGSSVALNMSGAVTEWMNSGKGRMDQFQKMANDASKQMGDKKNLTPAQQRQAREDAIKRASSPGARSEANKKAIEALREMAIERDTPGGGVGGVKIPTAPK